MKTDIEIAQEARMKPITQIAAQLGLEEESVIPYGRYKAKIDHRLIHNAKKQGKLILSHGNVDYIPPAAYGEDLDQAQPEEIAGLLKQIGTESGYERIVVDMGHMGKGALELFAACDVVYMPVLDDPVSTAKLEDFETYLKEAGHKGMEEKIQKLHLPEIKTGIRRGGYMEQLLWSEMGDYVRKLLEGGY